MAFQLNSLPFNWLDILLGVILVFAVARSLWTGFSRSIATLLGIVLGFWVAINRFSSMSAKLAPWIQDDLWRSLVSFLLLFFLVYLTFLIAGILTQGFFRVLQLGWVDRFLGGVLGLAKGLLLAGALIFLMTVLLPTNSPVLKKSVLYPSLSRVAKAMVSMVPDHIRGRFMWKWRKLQIPKEKVNGQKV